MKITINAGHYPGLDSGACGASGLQEAAVVANIGHKVCDYLNAVGYETLFVQENELQAICDASNAYGADLFISLHCNAAANTSAQGTETFCMSETSEGGKLAKYIHAEIINSLGTIDRGVKTAGFYVLRYTDCPAVLVETAFISNEEDEALLADESKLDEFAKAIARGITNYVAVI